MMLYIASSVYNFRCYGLSCGVGTWCSTGVCTYISKYHDLPCISLLWDEIYVYTKLRHSSGTASD